MWSQRPGSRDVSRSEIACHACRRRKVKCDREIPQCRVCEQTGQNCDYPLKAGKPGPKIGTTQRPGRRRRRMNIDKQQQQQQSDSQSSGCPPTPQDDGGRSLSGSRSAQEDSPATDRDTDEQRGTGRRNSKLNISDLSFILHPCHEASTPDNPLQDQSPGEESRETSHPLLFQRACVALGLSPSTVIELIQIYFRNMVSVSLFHQPSFEAKLASISTTTQLCALLAAMIGFSAKFYQAETFSGPENGTGPAMASSAPVEYVDVEAFQVMAIKFINEVLAESDDDQPPLCVVQALIISTHCQLIRGVHGKAWRSLGMCVRLAYELNLHLIDARRSVGDGQQDSMRWVEDEEKRRVWWAIWEMDVFASTIRRTPAAIDWSHMEVFLPVHDPPWFNSQPVTSPFLERDPIQRWKSLQATSNQSLKAWFLVINSLMKDAQILSSPRGIHFDASNEKQHQWRGTVHYGSQPPGSRAGCEENTTQLLEILANAVQCFILALPEQLRYRNQYLDFDESAISQGRTHRQLHSGIYNIFLMSQLARLMIYRHNLFREPLITDKGGARQSQKKGEDATRSFVENPENSSVRQFFEAADNILSIINRSPESHIQHINPFLSSTIWLASAVQLVRKYVGMSLHVKPCLIKSRFDVLYMTYKRCVDFWDTKTAMQQNLEALESQLESQVESDVTSYARDQHTSTRMTPDGKRVKHSSWIPDVPSERRQEAETGGSPLGSFEVHFTSKASTSGPADQSFEQSMGQFRPVPLGYLQPNSRRNGEYSTEHASTNSAQPMLHFRSQKLDSSPQHDDSHSSHQQRRSASDQVMLCSQPYNNETSRPLNEGYPAMFDMGSMPAETMDTSPFGADDNFAGMDEGLLDCRSPQLPTIVQELLSGVSTY